MKRSAVEGSDAGTRLRTIIFERKLTMLAAAKQLGCTGPALFKWIELEPLRRAKPVHIYRHAIELWTAGAAGGPIFMGDWDDESDKAILAHVQTSLPQEAA